MALSKGDIETNDDIVTLIDSFYTTIKKDELIGYILMSIWL